MPRDFHLQRTQVWVDRLFPNTLSKVSTISIIAEMYLRVKALLFPNFFDKSLSASRAGTHKVVIQQSCVNLRNTRRHHVEPVIRVEF